MTAARRISRPAGSVGTPPGPLVNEMNERAVVTDAVVQSIGWLLDAAFADGHVDLGDRRIGVVGAAAELAPTREWLAAGADVLWLDLVDPDSGLLADPKLGGRLSWVEGGVDLLRNPCEVAATVLEFARAGPVDLGLYAYAPCAGREWLLTRAMNAIVAALPATVIRTVTTLVSPSSPAVLGTRDLGALARRRASRRRWEAAAEKAGLLGRGGGCITRDGVQVSRSVISIQGASYQAAQYLGKLMTAEAGATAAEPLHVSANVAAISRTRSVQDPVFDVAFLGAEAFRVETFAPETTRALNGLLALRDWLDTGAPGAPTSGGGSEVERADALRSARVHGGIHVLPYPLDPALRVATWIGLARNPFAVAGLPRTR